MVGHTPYETWKMYYYHRPYQMRHVQELQNSALGVNHLADNANVFSNDVFRRLNADFAERLALETDSKGFEFVGRPQATPINGLHGSPQDVEPMIDVEPEFEGEPEVIDPSENALGQR